MFTLLSGLAQWMCARPEAKVLLIGDSGSGKTTFAEHCKRAYVPKYAGIAFESIGSTIGMNLARLSMPAADVTLWDVGGTMKNIWGRYYGDADGVIFMIDASSTSSIPAVRATINDVLNHAAMPESTPFAVVLNKSDLGIDLAAWKQELGQDLPLFVPDTGAEVRGTPTTRRCKLFVAGARKGDGVDEALRWMVSQSLEDA